MTPSGKLARQVHADAVGLEKIHRLAEHGGLGFDAADTPAEHAQPVDHGGVRVDADEAVGVVHVALVPHDLRHVLEVDLMADAVARRNDLEGLERLRAPLQELVALAVALELDLHVLLQRVGAAVVVDLHRMVDDEVRGAQRFDDLGILALRFRGFAHRGEVDHQRHAGHVLQQHARDHDRHFLAARRLGLPVGEMLQVRFGDFLAVEVAQRGFEHHAQAHRQARNLGDAGFFERRQRIVLARLARAEFEFLQRIE